VAGGGTLVSVFELSCATCNFGLSSRLPSVFVYFPIVFTRFRITVYSATISASGCPAPAPVSVKKYENGNDRGIFRSFPSVFILTHEQSTGVEIRRSAGEPQQPLTTNSSEPATNNHQHVPDLHHCSKPSRWRQPPRETRITQQMNTQVPTRCKLTSKYT
jgi:hypothetical protein